MWRELYNEKNQPTWENIKTYVKSDLWIKLCNHYTIG